MFVTETSKYDRKPKFCSMSPACGRWIERKREFLTHLETLPRSQITHRIYQGSKRRGNASKVHQLTIKSEHLPNVRFPYFFLQQSVLLPNFLNIWTKERAGGFVDVFLDETECSRPLIGLLQQPTFREPQEDPFFCSGGSIKEFREYMGMICALESEQLILVRGEDNILEIQVLNSEVPHLKDFTSTCYAGHIMRILKRGIFWSIWFKKSEAGGYEEELASLLKRRRNLKEEKFKRYGKRLRSLSV